MTTWRTIIMKKLMIITFLLFTTNVFANPINDTVNNVTNWAVNEKAKTIAYQKKSWAEGKAQLTKSWTQIKNLFGIN